MVDISPGTALLAALQAQFSAARQGQNQGVGSSIPGLGGGDAGNALNATPGSLATPSLGGGVGSATSGQSLANSLIGGAPAGGDPLARQVSTDFFGSNEGGQPERPDITGGDADMLAAIGMLGPLAVPLLLGQIVSQDVSQNAGNSFIGGDRDIQGNPRPAPAGTTIGPDGRLMLNGQSLGGLGPIGTFASSDPRAGFDRDRDRPERRERTLQRERTTGRASGPV